MSLDLAVIESRWWEDGNSSVRGLFDLLADIHKDNPAAYHYEMFNNQASLAEIVQRIATRYRNIYIASHGNEQLLAGAEERETNKVSRAELRNILRIATGTSGAPFSGLFVGSCKFINQRNANFLLRNTRGRQAKLRWIAGYAKRIDFIDSSVIDLFFWNTYYRSYYKAPEETESQRIRTVAAKVHQFMPGANKKLAFNIFLRRGQRVTSLLPNVIE